MIIREIARSTLASAVHMLKTVKVGHRITDSRFASWVSGDGAVIAKLRYGAQAVVFANEYNGRAMYLWGEHDPRISDVITAALRTGDTALDIGANFGVTGLLASKCVGSSGTVHLFEPQPIVASCLRTSLLINGYTNGIVHECALSDRTRKAEMTVRDTSNWGMTTLSPYETSSRNSTSMVEVRTERAGDYLFSLQCRSVALIKIDVEGHEAVVLASMREWLATMRPPIIVFECHLEGSTFQKHETVLLLSSLGYAFLGIDVKPYWRTKLYQVEEQHPIGYDFIAVRWQEMDNDRRNALEAMMA